MISSAVIGLGFGDEGKGLVTDFLASINHSPIVTRYSGGHQAGHTVVYKFKRHVHSSFGSGTLRGVPSYLNEFCTVDPIAVINELNKLKEIDVNPTLYINSSCPVTTPFEAYVNTANKEDGTCGVGVGPTWRREEKLYSLMVGDLRFNGILETKLGLFAKLYDINVDIKRFMECCAELIKSKNIQIVNEDPYNFDDHVIFEGSQGLLLDQNIGFFPHVTSSNVGTKNIAHHNPWCYLVTRAYQTRHGNMGP
jgi:adenylosuccinate synthase